MDDFEFISCLAGLRLTPKEAATLLSVDPKTVARWQDGDAEVSGPAEQAIRAWMRLDKLGLAWRPKDHLIGLTDEEAADQIRRLRDDNIGLADVIARVQARGGPAAPWKVDLDRHVAELGDIIELGFYPGYDGRFSPSTYRRKDRETDLDRDRSLIDDGIVAIANAIATAGPNWQRKRGVSEPDKIEYCLLSGEVLNSFDYPVGYDTSREAGLTVAQHVLGSYWHLVDGNLQPKAKIRPLPDFVRVIDRDGGEICRWSATDLQTNNAGIEMNDWSTAPRDGSLIYVRFPDGETVTKARWNVGAGQWEAPRRGKWTNMRDAHGARAPVVWWR